MLYNTGSVWTETVAAGLASGKTVDQVWSGFSDELLKQAKENPDYTPPKRDIDLD